MLEKIWIKMRRYGINERGTSALTSAKFSLSINLSISLAQEMTHK